MNRISWKSTSGLALAAMVYLMAAPASAEIVYNVTNYELGQNGWKLAGTITVSAAGTYTDNVSAITAWNLTATKEGSTSYLFANNAGDDPAKYLHGTLEATSSELLLNTNGNFSLFSKDNEPYSSLGWSNAWDFGNGVITQYRAEILDAPLWDTSAFSPVDGSAWVLGTTSAVPEIDPATGSSALSLVAGVLAMIEQRRRRAMLVA